jgi:hypothetical protein
VPSIGGPSLAEAACEGVSFDHCEEDMEFAVETYPSGKLIVICDAGNGKGSVVALSDGSTPEVACTEHALDPGAPLRVITLP